MMPFFDYRPGLAPLRAEIEEALRRVIDSGQLILGPEVAAFEEEFADAVGVEHAIGVASGTDALTLALRALGIGPGDEVITVANAGVAPVAGIRASGAGVRFVDVDPATWLIDPARIEGACNERTRAIVAVHLYGLPVDLDAIGEVARRRGLRLVEDCAQAHGARHRGRTAGSVGDVGCFSFYPTKNLPALGDGGLCVTRDEGLAQAIREQRMYGFRGDRHAHVEGRNSRLDEIQAAVLRVALKRLDRTLAERRELAARYRAELPEALRLQRTGPDDGHAYHLFVARHAARERLRAALAERDVATAVHYPLPVHRMEAYAQNAGEALPESERACDEVLSLPLYPGLPEPHQTRVLEAMAELAR